MTVHASLVEAAEPRDARAIHARGAKAFGDDWVSYFADPPDLAQLLVQRQQFGLIAHVARREGVVVGFAVTKPCNSRRTGPLLEGQWCELLFLYVDPDVRANGLGTELVASAAAEAATHAGSALSPA